MAHIITSKCCDSIPFYRLEKQFARIGLDLSRSTMSHLFHQSAEILKPLWNHRGQRIRQCPIVLADETPLPVLDEGKTHKGYVWTFLTEEFVYYHYSASRSGEVPRQVLGQSEGTLLVDGYTGYNTVCTPDQRIRAGCWAHVRRKFFEA
jgi:transposase